MPFFYPRPLPAKLPPSLPTVWRGAGVKNGALFVPLLRFFFRPRPPRHVQQGGDKKKKTEAIRYKDGRCALTAVIADRDRGCFFFFFTPPSQPYSEKKKKKRVNFFSACYNCELMHMTPALFSGFFRCPPRHIPRGKRKKNPATPTIPPPPTLL